MIYVMSDVHGNLKNFNSIMEQIELKPDDTLYILGDVIDRYPDGIVILSTIMKMSNVKMLLGNHEYMMLNAIDDGTDYPEDRRFRALKLWYNNDGGITHDELKYVSPTEREAIFKYLRELPLNYDISLNGKKFKLVHGAAVEKFKRHMLDYSNEKEFAVWYRNTKSDDEPEDYTLIFGHTPTRRYQSNNPLSIWYGENIIGIDCGCGYPAPNIFQTEKGRLACLRLDDMKEFYSS